MPFVRLRDLSGYVFVSLVAAPAFAFSTYNPTIPNQSGGGGCQACHGTASTSRDQLNPFGQDWRGAKGSSPAEENNLTAAWPAWAAVFDVDSDGDGQTNGEELGDPCGVFASGVAPARTENVSNAGVPSSLSATPYAPDADADAVSDGCDNCPALLNTDQTDVDADDIGDACDDDVPAEGEGEGDVGAEGEGEGEEPRTGCACTGAAGAPRPLASALLAAGWLLWFRRRR